MSGYSWQVSRCCNEKLLLMRKTVITSFQSTGLRSCWSGSILQSSSLFSVSTAVWFGSTTKQDNSLQPTVECRKDVGWAGYMSSTKPTFLPSRTCTPAESGNGQRRSLQTSNTQDTTCFNSSPLVGAQEHCRPHTKSFLQHTITLMNS